MNLKEIGKVFTSKFVGTGPSPYKKRIYRAAVSQRWRNTALEDMLSKVCKWASASIGPRLGGNMEGRSFPRAFCEKKFLILRNFYEGFERYAKMSCKRVSLSIGALLGNLFRFAGHFERKEKVYLASFLGTRGH